MCKAISSSLTPAPFVPRGESYLGSVYQYAGYGDMLRLWVTPDHMEPFALLALLDGENGITHASSTRPAGSRSNVMPNGASGLLSRIADPWTWGATQERALLHAARSLGAGPDRSAARRSQLPSTTRPPAASSLIPTGRPTARCSTTSASWISINHQDGSGG